MTSRFLRILLACVAACAFSGASAQAQAPNLETTDVMIPSGDDPAVVQQAFCGQGKFSADKILLFVHGATYRLTAFDLPIEGYR